jgi:hypothetical protein
MRYVLICPHRRKHMTKITLIACVTFEMKLVAFKIFVLGTISYTVHIVSMLHNEYRPFRIRILT